MKDNTGVFLAVIVAIVVTLAVVGKKNKESLDNPLFFLAMVSVFVYGFGAVGRLAGTKVGSPGLVSFFGGK